MKNIIVLYHAECGDGFGAAWSAWKKFGDSADYIPVSHGYSYPDNFSDKEIYTLDLTLPREITEKLLKANKRLTSIDHHIGAEEVTKMTQEYSFDNNHSGSVLAWKYFHPEKQVPRLLLFIEDVDIWKWEYPETGNFISALNLYDFSFELFDKVALEIEDPIKLKEYLSRGEVISQHDKKITDELVKTAILVEFDNYKVYAVNAPDFIKSELGHELSKSSPFAIVWRQKKDKVFVSLRSSGNINVSEIAKKYGGGGHKGAASFSFPVGQPFPWKIIDSHDS
jgi:uncharacterized protein